MHKNARTQQQNKRLAVALVAAFLAATGLLCWLVGVPMVRLASEPEVFRQWIQQRRLGGQLVYVGMVMLQVLAAVIPGEPWRLPEAMPSAPGRGPSSASSAGPWAVFW